MKLVKTVNVGRTVLCDMCNKDYTNSKERGGFLFGSKAVCPSCAPKTLISIKKYKEEWNITGKCPIGKSFADWIRDDVCNGEERTIEHYS